MPSWNEKPVAVPTVNVNLKPCNCPAPKRLSGLHDIDCAAEPVLIPCPLPRSVTFTVRLGRCQCAAKANPTRAPDMRLDHLTSCPARPIRVSCSIGGKMWAESEVGEVDWQTRNERGDWCPSPMSYAEHEKATRLCREHWALVKALVLGRDEGWRQDPKSEGWNLQPQRDAVFAALVDLARTEDGGDDAALRATRAMGSNSAQSQWPRRSVARLAEYVERLVEQVGAL